MLLRLQISFTTIQSRVHKDQGKLSADFSWWKYSHRKAPYSVSADHIDIKTLHDLQRICKDSDLNLKAERRVLIYSRCEPRDSQLQVKMSKLIRRDKHEN